MAKYAVFFSYSSDAWARMINNPGDRTAAVRQVVEAVGGTLESAYWMFGDRDGIIIVDAPDSVTIAAVSIAVASTGALKHEETRELLTQQQLGQALEKAKNVAQVYQPPGQQG